jgi:HAD superfamily hydrolase (TIGR01509 family)
MQTKAIIFDCFGVFYPDGSSAFFENHREFFTAHTGVVLDKLNEEIDLGKITKAEFLEGMHRETGISQEEIRSEIYGKMVLNEEILTLAKELKRSHKLGLLSNGGKEEIEIIYNDKIDALFDVITVSYKVGVVKPNPSIYLACVQEFGVTPEECIFIDDRSTNVAGAKNVGMQAILFRDTHQLKKELLKYNINCDEK